MRPGYGEDGNNLTWCSPRGDSGGAVTVLKRLLRRNPKNPLGLERRRQAQGAG